MPIKLSYAGEGLLFEPSDFNEFRGEVEKFQPQDWFRYSDHPYGEGDCCYNWRPSPELKINELYNPTGASRFAMMFVLADQDTYEKIIETIDTDNADGSGINKRDKAELKILDEYDVEIFKGDFHVVNERVFFQSESRKVYILPLVDQRYLWQFRKLTLDVDSYDAEASPFVDWAAAIIALFGISGGSIPSIHADYGVPNSAHFVGKIHENYGQLLDMVLDQVNIRLIYDHANKFAVLKQYNTDAISSSEVPNIDKPDFGGYTPHLIPNKLKFVFRHAIDSVIQSGLFKKKEYNLAAETSLKDWARVGNSTDYVATHYPIMLFDVDSSDDSNNETDLDDYVDKWAIDWLNWQAANFDMTWTRLKPQSELLTAWQDYTLYRVGTLVNGQHVLSTRTASWPADVVMAESFPVVAEAAEQEIKPVVIAKRDYDGVDGVASGNTGLSEVSHVMKLPFESNDITVINDGNAFFGGTLLKKGVYAYNISWCVTIDDPLPEDESVTLLTTQLEFSHDVDGHVDGIRNGLSSEGNNNPSLQLVRHPQIDVILFLYDGQNSSATSSNGTILCQDEAGNGFDTIVRGVGTDSNGDAYGTLWGYYLDSGQLGRVWQGCMSGAFYVTQATIDAMNGGLKMGVEFKRSAISIAGSFSWGYNSGGNIIYSDHVPIDGVGNNWFGNDISVSPISPPTPP